MWFIRSLLRPWNVPHLSPIFNQLICVRSRSTAYCWWCCWWYTWYGCSDIVLIVWSPVDYAQCAWFACEFVDVPHISLPMTLDRGEKSERSSARCDAIEICERNKWPEAGNHGRAGVELAISDRYWTSFCYWASFCYWRSFHFRANFSSKAQETIFFVHFSPGRWQYF